MRTLINLYDIESEAADIRKSLRDRNATDLEWKIAEEAITERIRLLTARALEPGTTYYASSGAGGAVPIKR